MSDEEPLEELRNLPREIAPPAAVESAVLASIRAGRRGANSRRVTAVAAAIAGVALLLAAMTVMLARPHADARKPTHMLLLFDSGIATPNANAAREYGAWARRNEEVVGGEELGAYVATVHDLAGATAAQSRLGGYFLVAVNSDREAARIANDCPHLRHGGTIVIRRIEQH